MTDKGTLDARKLVTCAAHGNDLECLGPSRGCDVKWTPGDSILHWDALAEAMVEGRAWKEGRRVYANQYEYVFPHLSDQEGREDHRIRMIGAECSSQVSSLADIERPTCAGRSGSTDDIVREGRKEKGIS